MLDRDAKDEAEALAYALESGFATLDQAKDWAYSRIATEDKPSEPLLELTGPNLHPTDAVHNLRDVSGRPRDVETLRRILRRFGSVLRADPKLDSAIARALFSMAIDPEWSACAGDLTRSLYSFDDELDLARTGVYGDRAEVVLRMQAFLDEA